MRLRYSPVTLVGMVVIIVLAIGWWRSVREHQQLIARHERLMKEWIEPLALTDATQVHFRKLPPRNVGFNQWKIYLPPGRKYALQCFYSDASVASGKSPYVLLESLPMEPGQSLLEVEWRRDVELKPQVFISILPPTGDKTLRTKVVFPEEFAEKFAQWETLQESYLGGDSETVAAPPKRLDVTVVTFKGGAKYGTGPEAERCIGGLGVWLQPFTESEAPAGTGTGTGTDP
jgi:hypothetical protein